MYHNIYKIARLTPRFWFFHNAFYPACKMPADPAPLGGLPGGIPAGMPLYAVFGAQWGSIATLSREGHRTAAGDEQGLSGAVAFARVQSTGREGCDEKGKTDRAGLAVSVPVSRGAGYGLCSPGACARTT